MRKCLLLFLLLLPFFLMQACFDDGGGGGSSTPAPVITVQLDVPYHLQTTNHTCAAVSAWMYVEYVGNQIGYWNTLPEDPEAAFDYILQQNECLVFIDGSYSVGLNYLLYYYTTTPDSTYTMLYLKPDEYFDQMLEMQKELIDLREPCVVGLEFISGIKHAVVLVGYEKNSETGEVVRLIVNDPAWGEPARKFTVSEWRDLTIWDTISDPGWFFISRDVNDIPELPDTYAYYELNNWRKENMK
jgi:hypothetical protein